MPREPDFLPDWFVGGAGKRRLLSALVRRDKTTEPWSAEPPWTQRSLASAAGLHPKHTVFRHIEILVLAGLLVEDRGGYRVNERSGLLAPVETFIDGLDELAPIALPRSRGKK